LEHVLCGYYVHVIAWILYFLVAVAFFMCLFAVCDWEFCINS